MFSNKSIDSHIILLFSLILGEIFSLPLDVIITDIVTADTTFKNLNTPDLTLNFDDADNTTEHNNTTDIVTPVINISSESFRNVTSLRPGQSVISYKVDITLNSTHFNGRAVLDLLIEESTIEEKIKLRLEDLVVTSVSTGRLSEVNTLPVEFLVNTTDGILEFEPASISTTLVVIIEYEGHIDSKPQGLYQGGYMDNTYFAMNTYPTSGRRVVPSLDFPDESSSVTFIFNNLRSNFNNIVANSKLVDRTDDVVELFPLPGPLHTWGLVAHNFMNINLPTTNVLLYGRVTGQDAIASLAINEFYNALTVWTEKDILTTINNQNEQLHVMAIPDSARDWVALSTVCIWEPHIFMQNTHSVMQRVLSFETIARSLSKLWFGFVLYPADFTSQWVIEGLGAYAAFDVLKAFQPIATSNDVSVVDVNAIFVADIIHESLLLDAYNNANIMAPESNFQHEDDIRGHIHGLMKYKAPALMSTFQQVLGSEDQDFIKSAAQALLRTKALQPISTANFVDSLNSEWLDNGNQAVDQIRDFLDEWIRDTGYPVINVGIRSSGNGIIITQERFAFSSVTQRRYTIPITYTTSVNPNFDDIYPVEVTDQTAVFDFSLDEDDWVVLNIQGQAYYRVNYDLELWERLIEALNDADRRAVIHPLNRATLVDDALNLARAGKLDYDIAFRVVLTMRHETEYPVWKAFIRNMNFLKKRFDALIAEDDDDEYDPDIYLRMVRRSLDTFVEQIGFQPDTNVNELAMTSLTRGIVMDHACRSNYDPCVAAAVDWFYDPNNANTVNPNIPNDLRPAVYCTMVREGGREVIDMLTDQLDQEPTLYERLVILESLACSTDTSFIDSYLLETIAANGPYTQEENFRIFKAVSESNYANAVIAQRFMQNNILDIKNRYGGTENIEELIYVIAHNTANSDMEDNMRIWVNLNNNNLFELEANAKNAYEQASEDLQWVNNYMMTAYEWIDENDASTSCVSIMLLLVSLYFTMYINH